MIARAALILVRLIIASLGAYGHPADVPNAEWYRGLRQPDGSGVSCCSEADCAETDYRVTATGEIEAQTPAREWVRVPPEKILRHTDNPTGYAVLCYAPNMGVMCFALPSGA